MKEMYTINCINRNECSIASQTGIECTCENFLDTLIKDVKTKDAYYFTCCLWWKKRPAFQYQSSFRIDWIWKLDVLNGLMASDCIGEYSYIHPGRQN